MPVLSRYPGEVFLQTGRTGVNPEIDPEFLIIPIEGFVATYILVDDDRFLREGRSPALKFPADFPGHLEQRLSVAGSWGKVVLYESAHGTDRRICRCINLVAYDRFLRDRRRPILKFPADFPGLLEARHSFAGSWGKVVVYKLRSPKLY